ncbi:hypothetical protein [Paraburkholderia tropica]|uniref:Uncharacterized protein n=1 Tax=Paraburkholderia tropica TaxID=92647 RepID=A0AAQ1GL63_9BURK|nr:hypothetical protein [Paraburkholderia tropica]RQN40803.1 hypothetical protein EHZ25_00640 [Paraburkholderia tropica]SEK09345.1 hypothetical protein SAMN05216550_117182 [Paraburkholderia tropica]
MGKKSSSKNVDVGSTQTTTATLESLLTQITEFVQAGTLDSRCAAKLGRRLRKEAEAIESDGRASQSELDTLKQASEKLDASLNRRNGKLLVEAYEALRDSDSPS